MRLGLACVTLLSATAIGCGSATIMGGHGGRGGANAAGGSGGGGGGGMGSPAGGAGGNGGAGAAGVSGSAGAAGGATGAAGSVAGNGGGGATAGTPGTAGTSGSGGAAGTAAAGTSGTAGGSGMAGNASVGGSPGAGGSGPTCSPACNTTTQTCVGTKCLLNDGQMCSLASQCVSNACTAFYLDQDGDGYGSGGAVGFCGNTPPVGYATQNGDCCDDPAHLAVSKLIHPGAGYQTASAAGVCNITWDYDCSGVIEQSAQEGICPSNITCPNCSEGTALITFTSFPNTECGAQVQACTACANGFACFTGDSCDQTNCTATTLGCR